MSELSRRLFGNNRTLLANGRQTRRSRSHRAASRLRSNLHYERGLYAARLAISRADVRRLRRRLRGVRSKLRPAFGGRRERFYGSLRRSLSPLRQIVPSNGWLNVVIGINVTGSKPAQVESLNIFNNVTRDEDEDGEDHLSGH